MDGREDSARRYEILNLKIEGIWLELVNINVRILKIATALVVRDLILIKRINMIRDLTIYKIRKYILKPITFSVKKLTMI